MDWLIPLMVIIGIVIGYFVPIFFYSKVQVIHKQRQEKYTTVIDQEDEYIFQNTQELKEINIQNNDINTLRKLLAAKGSVSV